MAAPKKSAHEQGRTIVFVDESGLSERPHRCRTWAPRGQTPVLAFNFNWHTLSMIGGITWWTFFFRLFRGAIRGPQVILFLEHLMRHLPGTLLVIWDGLSPHRGRLVRDFVAEQQGRIVLEFLPAYAPDLNPAEYIWGYLKQHQLPNLCPKSFWDLNDHCRRALRRMRRRPTLVRAFWEQAQLFEF